MKIVVRDRQTCQFLKQTAVYTTILDEAVDFLCPELAYDFCIKHKLNDHEVLVEDEGILALAPPMEEGEGKKKKSKRR